MNSIRRMICLLTLFLLFVCSTPIVTRADDQVTSFEVERGTSRTVDVLNYLNASAGKLDTVVVKEPAYGSAKIEGGGSITYTATDRIGETIVTYTGADATGRALQGTIAFSNVLPKRIVTFDLTRLAGVLGVILVLAIVLEIGLSTLFNWKYFQEHLLGKGLRTPIAVVVSAYFVYHYELDTVADLLSSFTGDSHASFARTTPGYIITAFIVAGGSGTVNQLFQKFGIRTPIQIPAQFVVDIVRQNVPSTAPVNVPIDGKLAATVDANRFPLAGAYLLSAGSHEIGLEARDATGTVKTVKQVINLDDGAEVEVEIAI